MEACRRVCCRAVHAGQLDTISVFRAKKRRAYMGGRVANPSQATVTFEFDELLMCLETFVKCNLVQIGNMVGRFQGVPIGGVLSKVVCSMILGVSEAT